MTAGRPAKPPHPFFTALVRTLGLADSHLAYAERTITVAALLAIVGVIFLQALLRYLSGVLPLGEWLDPQRFMPPEAASVALLDRLALALRRAASTLYDVIVRGGGEIARYSMVWAAVLGASVATRERRHIAVDALPRLMESRGKPLAKEWLVVVAAALAALLTLYLAWAGWVLFQAPPIQMRLSAALRIPIKYVALAIPVGAFITSLRFLGTAASGTFANLGLIDPAIRYRGGGGLQALLAERGPSPVASELAGEA